ncbi:hypothetical protein [Mycobacteroides abscessus]|uniref:hypothetical protein n=1 Tax=Mycobacteroides abscessus TaxID=36809 RepID=UPI000E68395A|nr:hypothetical protein [Mycobacteroides abscessus]RIS87407.1 hypothetical protein D2E44_02515 [Mycobacteroides abscessus]
MSYSGAVSPLKVLPRESVERDELPTFEFTGAEVIAEIRRLAQRFPDQKAEGKYVGNDDRPHCIGGRALANLGVPLGLLIQAEGTTLDTMMSRLRIESTYRQRRWLRATQGNQDRGEVWHAAVNQADIWHPESEVTA